jgi:hypothetical protein
MDRGALVAFGGSGALVAFGGSVSVFGVGLDSSASVFADLASENTTYRLRTVY